MYRQIFTPSKKNSKVSIAIPHEWYGQMVEIIAFPVSTPVVSQKKINDDAFYRLSGAWESDQDAEEMVAEIRATRTFRKKDLSF
ncbi:MAG: hypothetical protein LBN93_11635 [Candidatus Symbiothrix sp.]|jgi:hypothetical protein|nr:hypothetical protein [Candidatus Symbiothrix sp.]